MSEFMQEMNRRAERSAQRSGYEFQANICLVVKEYDLQAAGGARVIGMAKSPEWAAGQEFSIRMQTREESIAGFRKNKSATDNAKFFSRRPTIEKIAEGTKVGNNNVPPVLPGGYLMAYGCLKDGRRPESGPAPWKAQYIDNYGNDPSRSVEAGVARITVREARQDGERLVRESGRMELLFPRDAEFIESADDLRRFVEDYMHGERDGARYDAMAAIRIVEELPPKEEGQSPRSQVISGFLYAARKEVEVTRGDKQVKISLPADASETIAKIEAGKGLTRLVYAALSGETDGLAPDQIKQVRALASDLEAGKLKIEAIPGRVLPIIGTTLEDVMKEGTRMNLAAAKCFYNNDAGAKVEGFAKMTVGLMAKPPEDGLPGPVIVTTFATEVGAKGMSINSVTTPNVQPVWGKHREAEAAKTAEAAAARGGEEAAPSREDPSPADEPEVRQEQASYAPGM